MLEVYYQGIVQGGGDYRTNGEDGGQVERCLLIVWGQERGEGIFK